MDTDDDERLDRIESLIADLALMATGGKTVESFQRPEVLGEAQAHLLNFLMQR
jgi:hypothetical protein